MFIKINNNSVEFVKVKLVNDFTLTSDKKLTNPKEVMSLITNELGKYDREIFAVVNLTSKCQVINVNICHVGYLQSSFAHPREIIKASILSNANSVIFIHNHPSGDTIPSNQDIEVTEKLINVYDIHAIKVLDHVICSYDENNYYSMKEQGMLF